MCENTYLLSFRNKMSELWSCFRWQCNADTLYANNKKIQKDHEGFELGWNFIVRLCHRGWSSTILLTERERKKVFSSLNDWWAVTNINRQTKEKNALFKREQLKLALLRTMSCRSFRICQKVIKQRSLTHKSSKSNITVTKSNLSRKSNLVQKSNSS